MKITLKLFASLGKFLPEGTTGNETEIEITKGYTLEQVLEEHGVPPEHCHLVLVNGHYVGPSERAAMKMKEGDALAVWPPVAGG
ncbi:MAG: MoaD/ThiS family protein [Rhodospirillaceae bacterium]|nr:MoaD/ThiS family protein [Rhodospirillaceae bacterium]